MSTLPRTLAGARSNFLHSLGCPSLRAVADIQWSNPCRVPLIANELHSILVPARCGFGRAGWNEREQRQRSGPRNFQILLQHSSQMHALARMSTRCIAAAVSSATPLLRHGQQDYFLNSAGRACGGYFCNQENGRRQHFFPDTLLRLREQPETTKTPTRLLRNRIVVGVESTS